MENTDVNETLSPTERISRLLETVDAGSPRHGALSAALDFKGSWIELARHLKSVEDSGLWEQWEYSSLPDYCKNELQLGRGEIRKLREGYEWLEKEAPQLLDSRVGPDGDPEAAASRQPAPDIEVVGQLARGWQDYEQERIPEDTYLELKRAALQGERSAHQLRREFKDAVPEHLRDKPVLNPRKHLKRALDALEKALNEIEQGEDGDLDPELFERARQLRDEIFHLVAVKSDAD